MSELVPGVVRGEYRLIMERDGLAARVTELEAENERLAQIWVDAEASAVRAEAVVDEVRILLRKNSVAGMEVQRVLVADALALFDAGQEGKPA